MASDTQTGFQLPGRRVLVAGASGDIGRAVMRQLAPHDVWLGAHYHERRSSLESLARDLAWPAERLHLLGGPLQQQAACHALVDAFVAWAGGIDAMVQLTGTIANPCSWQDLSEQDWLTDVNVNLSGPFFLAQRAMAHMRGRGGRLVLMSTASARHGGGRNSLAYGVAKAGIECLTKGLARDGAADNILVNAIAPGFIDTQFHVRRAGRDAEAMRKRAELIPLRRAGSPDDVARLIVYLLSSGGDYITGECVSVSGGDWL
jgi:3-oxoacyl-[acyl-carrier protein] reductase